MAAGEGYIKLHRKLRKWEWYDDANTMRVFIHLLLNATWCETEYRGEKLMPGDVVFSRKKYAKELKLSERATRTSTSKLKKSGEISTIKTTNRFTIFHIENWTFYQGQMGESDQQNDQQTTSRPQKNDQQNDHIQEIYKNKESKEIDTDARAREGPPENEKKYEWEISAIIQHLNDKCGKKYKRTESSRKVITARLDEGYTLNDLYTVVDNQCARWLDDPERNQFLAPALLFDGDKIERYLNSPPIGKNGKGEQPLDFEKIAQKIRKGYSHMRLTKKEAAAIPWDDFIEIKDHVDELTDEQIVEKLKGVANGIV